MEGYGDLAGEGEELEGEEVECCWNKIAEAGWEEGNGHEEIGRAHV